MSFGTSAFAQLAIAQQPFVFISGEGGGGGVGLPSKEDYGPPRKVRIKKRQTFEELEALVAAEVEAAIKAAEAPVVDLEDITEPEQKPLPERFDSLASLLQAAEQARRFGVADISRVVPHLVFPPSPSSAPVQVSKPSLFDAAMERFRSTMGASKVTFDAMLERYRKRNL